MQQFRMLIIAIIFIMPTWVSASLVTWTDPTPSPLAPFKHNLKQLAELAGQDIVVYSHPVQKIQFNSKKGLRTYSNAQFSSAAVVVSATPQQIHDVLKNYTGYVGLFPTLKKAKTLHTKDNISQVKYRISIPTPIKVLNFNEDITVQHHLTQNSLSSLIVDAPIEYSLGKIEWFAIDTKRSLITLTQWSDLNATHGFLINTLLKAMPEIRDGIPYGSNTFILEALNLKFNGKPAVKTLEAGKLPSKNLNPAQYQQIVQVSQNSHQPVSFVLAPYAIPYKHGNETLRFTSSYQYYNSASSKTQKLLEPTVYQTLFPRHLKKIDLIPNQDQTQDAIFHVRAGLGVITIPFTLRMRFAPINDGVDMYAVGGDMKFVRSRMWVQPYAEGSVWVMTTAARIDNSAPFLLRAMRSLPYHDVLPASAMARVINVKARDNLGF